MVGARTKDGAIVHADAGLERATVGVELGKTVEPNVRVLHDAIEAKRAKPHIGGTRVGLHGGGHDERAAALFGDTGGA